MTAAWALLGTWSHVAGALGCALLAAWTWRGRASGEWRGALAVALAGTALWSLFAAADRASLAASLAEMLRNLAWLWLLYRLFAGDGRHASVAPVRPVLAVLALVELMQPALLLTAAQLDAAHPVHALIFRMAVLFRLLLSVGALVLVHNLYAGAMPAARSVLRWAAAAMAAMWIYDLNFYTVAYLGNGAPEGLAALRGLTGVVVAMLLGLGAAHGADTRLRPSRAVAFQSLSLLVIGGYLLVMFSAAQALAFLGGGVAVLAQLGFAFAAAVLALGLLPSARLRGWLKVTVAKHFFQHRYDYRAEWLRFTRTIGRGDSAMPLQERVIQAVADITDSAAGLLLTPAEHGELALSARWQWRTIEVPAEAMCLEAARFFESDGFIADLDAIRAGKARHGEDAVVSAWLIADERAWALVPLLHYERLVGVVVLARPPHARTLDWEDFDLLRVVGQQLASYLAEHAGQEALLDASRFDEFNRRIAFVMHDIKNLASQLTLLARNAERHADNPEFRADMLVTLTNSAEKLNTLLTRLSRYGASHLDRIEEVDAVEVARTVAAAQRRSHPVAVGEEYECRVIGNRETLEQVLTHLVQNAVDASDPRQGVLINVGASGLHGWIEVVNSGCGMSAEFVRNRLFKPFVSSKPGGFGIGAFEARELVRAMQGRLDVESREGLGSRFVVRLPLAEAAGLLRTMKGRAADPAEQKVA